MSAPGPHLSIVVPTYRRCASVQRLLTALARQTLPPGTFEVVVSIDGSDDGTRELVAGFGAPYELRGIWQPNRGRAGACNAGIRESRGELVVILDDDMEPEPGCLQAHLEAHAGAPRRAVLGAVPLALDGVASPVAEYVKAKFDRHHAKLSRPGYRIGFRDFYSGHLSIRRDLLREVGLFDQDFTVYGNEDGELALRLLRAGVEVVYRGEAVAAQHYEKDFAALARDNVGKGRTAVLCVRKHPETFAELRLAGYRHASRKWRLVRAGLLRLSESVRRTPDSVIWLMTRLERRRPARLHRYYQLALDYFFWLGAIPALREGPVGPPDSGLPRVRQRAGRGA